MKFRTIQVNSKWYIQRKIGDKHDWTFLTYRFTDGRLSWEMKWSESFYFESKETAENYIKNTVYPYYHPEIKNISDFYLSSKKQKCMFELLERMLNAEKSGNMVLAKEINDQLLELHGIDQEMPKNSFLGKIKKVLGL